tara:strand:- start:131 stop:247 length:117 start_codon:yes stop_codon:yes gene_type:complete
MSENGKKKRKRNWPLAIVLLTIGIIWMLIDGIRGCSTF